MFTKKGSLWTRTLNEIRPEAPLLCHVEPSKEGGKAETKPWELVLGSDEKMKKNVERGKRGGFSNGCNASGQI